jgi:ABC-type transporter Mla subunit MlaD
MGTKGEERKVLDSGALETVVFSCNKFIIESNEDIVTIQTEIRNLKNNGLDKLSGGQGEYIVDSIRNTEKFVEQLRLNLTKISKILDEKLNKLLGAYKDKTGNAEQAAQAAALANKAGLTRK